MVQAVARAATKPPRRSVKTIRDFESMYVPKKIDLHQGEQKADLPAAPDLVSDALRSLRRTLR